MSKREGLPNYESSRNGEAREGTTETQMDPGTLRPGAWDACRELTPSPPAPSPALSWSWAFWSIKRAIHSKIFILIFTKTRKIVNIIFKHFKRKNILLELVAIYFRTDPASTLTQTCLPAWETHIPSFSPECPEYPFSAREGPLPGYSGMPATHKHSLRNPSSHPPQHSFKRSLKENQWNAPTP